jgi:hypothetical protein
MARPIAAFPLFLEFTRVGQPPKSFIVHVWGAAIAVGADSGDLHDNNAYTNPLPTGTVKQLPANSLDALRCLEADTVLTRS